MIRPEILAPAGDLERLHAAVQYGADAVYLGGKQFGMRSAPQNFGPRELEEAVLYCHERGVRVYLTCNTLPTNGEADLLPEFIRTAAGAGVDALIAADVGVLMLAKRLAPELEIHVSTQTGVVNYLTAAELYHMGAKRVVLAREISLEDIAVIRDKTPPELEIEAFVHGAMCMSFSGRCLISNYLLDRDANRGECAQPCRWGYYLMEEKRPGLYFPVVEEEGGAYILNAQDLCMLPHLDDMAKAGIDSLKIEGRAKSAYYVAVVTNAYRCAADWYERNPERYKETLPAWLLEETRKVSHRQYSTGFYLKEKPPGQYYACRGYIREWDVIATVEDWRDGWLYCVERNRFFRGQQVEVLQPGKPPHSMAVEEIRDEENCPIEAACHPMMKLRIPCAKPFPAGSIVRRRREVQDESEQSGS